MRNDGGDRTDTIASPVASSARARAARPELCLDLAEALIRADGVLPAVRAAARHYCREGASLELFLDDVDATYLGVDGEPAPAEVVREIAVSWTALVQAWSAEQTCLDPATGLTSLPHAQLRLDGLYRRRDAATCIAAARLVVIDLPPLRDDLPRGFAQLEDALRQALVVDVVEEVVPWAGPPASAGRDRLVVVVEEAGVIDDLEDVLQRRLDDGLRLTPSRGRCRTACLALPASVEAARRLLAQQARPAG